MVHSENAPCDRVVALERMFIGKDLTMARKNRLVVNDGIYHVTTRIANRAFLFRDDKLKDRIVEWMYGVADFSGVELLAWCVMENHLHLMVHVPPVPERLWLDGDYPPSPSSFTLRPAECNTPRWSPGESAGNSPQVTGEEFREIASLPAASIGNSTLVSGDGFRPRPPVGFMFSDEEMVSRLACLYGRNTAERKGVAWARLREKGMGGVVNAEKERYCRRMYNISQFVKTLKERIAMRYNSGTSRSTCLQKGGGHQPEHSGHLFEGRFLSVIVGNTAADLGAVASYIGVNPIKARIADSLTSWRWSSFSLAVRGDSPWSERCRGGYEHMFGCGWGEAMLRMEAMMSDRLPVGFTPDGDRFMCEVDDGGGMQRRPLRVTQAIWLKVKAFTQGMFVSRDESFVKGILAEHPRNFPHGGTWSVEFCRRLDWTLVA